MRKEPQPVDVGQVPELLRIAEEVRATNEPRVLRKDGEDLAILEPLPKKKRTSLRGRPLTRDDALFRLIGIGRSKIPGGVSGKKHEYLLEAYRQHLQ